MGWKEHYMRNMVSVDEAVAMISPGDNVAISLDPKPTLLMDALVAHHEQLDDLRIFDVAPHYNPGWLHPNFEGSFRYSAIHVPGVCGSASLLRAPHRFCSRNLYNGHTAL